uniref:F-box domain-containing protein n=1 Tax=Parastrongyloides trichosuri TaxID=131310 RepID=A0A0N5A1H8_PARTI
MMENLSVDKNKVFQNKKLSKKIYQYLSSEELGALSHVNKSLMKSVYNYEMKKEIFVTNICYTFRLKKNTDNTYKYDYINFESGIKYKNIKNFHDDMFELSNSIDKNDIYSAHIRLADNEDIGDLSIKEIVDISMVFSDAINSLLSIFPNIKFLYVQPCYKRFLQSVKEEYTEEKKFFEAVNSNVYSQVCFYIITQLKGNNVELIDEIPLRSITSYFNEYKKDNEAVFYGFPKLKEIVIAYDREFDPYTTSQPRYEKFNYGNFCDILKKNDITIMFTEIFNFHQETYNLIVAALSMKVKMKFKGLLQPELPSYPLCEIYTKRKFKLVKAFLEMTEYFFTFFGISTNIEFTHLTEIHLSIKIISTTNHLLSFIKVAKNLEKLSIKIHSSFLNQIIDYEEENGTKKMDDMLIVMLGLDNLKCLIKLKSLHLSILYGTIATRWFNDESRIKHGSRIFKQLILQLPPSIETFIFEKTLNMEEKIFDYLSKCLQNVKTIILINYWYLKPIQINLSQFKSLKNVILCGKIKTTIPQFIDFVGLFYPPKRVCGDFNYLENFYLRPIDNISPDVESYDIRYSYEVIRKEFKKEKIVYIDEELHHCALFRSTKHWDNYLDFIYKNDFVNFFEKTSISK